LFVAAIFYPETLFVAPSPGLNSFERTLLVVRYLQQDGFIRLLKAICAAFVAKIATWLVQSRNLNVVRIVKTLRQI
jgi:hypothetical protein